MLPIKKSFFVKSLVMCLLLVPAMAFAAGINFKNFKVVGNAPKYQVLTGIEFDLTDYLQNALESGVALNMRVQFRLNKHQDWWFNKETTLLTVPYELKYHALSQHYLLTRNDTNEHWNFSNLSAALRKLGEFRKYILPDLKMPLDGGDFTILAVADMVPATLQLPLRFQSLFSDKYRLVSEGLLWRLP